MLEEKKAKSSAENVGNDESVAKIWTIMGQRSAAYLARHGVAAAPLSMGGVNGAASVA
jgi:hypothetical protein